MVKYFMQLESETLLVNNYVFILVSFKLGELGFIVTKRVVIGISVFALTMAVLAYRINHIPLEKWSGYH